MTGINSPEEPSPTPTPTPITDDDFLDNKNFVFQQPPDYKHNNDKFSWNRFFL